MKPRKRPVTPKVKSEFLGSRFQFPRETRHHSIEITKSKGYYSAFGYRAARVADKEGRSPVAGSEDSHALYDRVRLIGQSRDFRRNNGIYDGMIDRASSYIVGNGFTLQSTTLDKVWNEACEDYFEDFWRRPEIRGTLSGRGVERMVCEELLTCGDHGAIKVDLGPKVEDRYKLQLVEAEQVVGPNRMDDGIVKAPITRKAMGYWVCPWGKSGEPLIGNKQKVDAENFLFLARLKRPSATRGVPPCQSSFPMIHRINDTCDSEAIAWQMLARIAFTVNRNNGPLIAQNTSTEDTGKSADDMEGDFATRIHELDDAIIFHGELGETVAGVDRNIPGKDFSASLTMFLRLLGLPLGLPLEIILLDWTKSNYSQSRAVLEQAYRSFCGWQYLMEDFFHTPVYEWAIQNGIADGKLTLPAGMTPADAVAHEWIKPTFPWIDPLLEAEAQAAKLDRSFSTQANVLKSLNSDRDEVLEARDVEIRSAIARAKAIFEETGEKVDWQIFAGLPIPVAVSQPMNAKPKGEAP